MYGIYAHKYIYIYSIVYYQQVDLHYSCTLLTITTGIVQVTGGDAQTNNSH